MELKDILRGAFEIATLGAESTARAFEEERAFPGPNNGPSDAYRHIYRAAYTAYKTNETYTDLLLDTRELLGGSTNSDMDYYNNAIGIEIGLYLKENGGTLEDIDGLVAKLVQDSMDNDVWIQLDNGIMVSDNSVVSLTDDLHVSTIAVMPESEWGGSRSVMENTRQVEVLENNKLIM